MTLAAVLWCAVVAGELAALVAAVRLIPGGCLHALRRPLPALLLVAVAVDLVVAALRAVVVDAAPRPLAGATRAAGLVCTTLVLAWPVALAWSSSSTFGGRLDPRRHAARVGLVLGAASAGASLLVVSPPDRGLAAVVLVTVEAIGVLVAVASIWRGWPLAWRAPEVAIVVLVAVEAVVLILGPFGHGAGVFRAWPLLARLPYAAGFWTAAAVVWAARRTP